MKAGLLLLCVWSFATVPFYADAQTKSKNASKTVNKKAQKTEEKIADEVADHASLKLESVEVHRGNAAPPKWSLAQGYLNDRPVYFPDYYLFYTPERGYIYWQEGQWVSGPEMPSFVKETDLKRARTHIIEDEEINAYPEKQFTRYRDDFPAEPLEQPVPVPVAD